MGEYEIDKEGRPVKPFYGKKLDEEKAPYDNFLNLRLNQEDLAMLEDALRWLPTEQKGTAFKMLASIGYNVSRSILGRDLLLRWFKNKR